MTEPAPAHEEPATVQKPVSGESARRRLRWPAAVVVAALVAVGLVVVNLYGTSADGDAERKTSPRSSTSNTPSEVSQADYDKAEPDVQALLVRRARAVTDKDESAWLADLDSQRPAFVAAQKQLFANLVKLPLSTYTYELATDRYGKPDLATTYGGRAFLRVAVLHYGLTGFDKRPAALAQGFTFVRRRDRWLLVSDSDLNDQVQRLSFTEPWEDGPVTVTASDTALVITDADGALDAQQVLRTVDASLVDVAESWPRGWSHKAVVVAVRSNAGITSLYAPMLLPDDFSALAFGLPSDVPTFQADKVEVTVAGRRIVFLPDSLNLALDRQLMTHELTHLATGEHGRSAPYWLREGFAEYVATRHQPARRLVRGTDIPQLLAGGPLTFPDEGSFLGARQYTNYALSALICRYLDQTYGARRLARLFETWDQAAGARQDPQLRQDRALRLVLGTDTAAVQRGLDSYVRSL